MPETVRAIIWDYDGTLVDTRQKNFNITRAILERVTGRPADGFQALRSPTDYSAALSRIENWRELYEREFGLNESEIDAAGTLWSEYQTTDRTSTLVFAGIPEALSELESLPHGVVSQNSKRHIVDVLRGAALLRHFSAIVGYEEVHLRRQKPAPDGLLMCVEELTEMSPGVVLYIGDHETDTRCAVNANCHLEKGNVPVRVISVGAFFDPEADDTAWKVTPDFRATHPGQITKYVRTLLDGTD